MPIYEYAPIAESCPHCAGRFEVFQRMSEDELSACPECGKPCKRVLSASNVAMSGSHHLKEKHIADKGFTQYRRVEKGKYEKTAGKGPDTIGSD
jgi:putative FmdB family regulatory protein